MAYTFALRPRVRAGAESSVPTPSGLWQAKVRDIWRVLQAQPLSFWLICTYLFLEYVRPQAIYPVIDVIPWAQVAILACLGAVLLEKARLRFPTWVSAAYGAFVVVVLLSGATAWNPELAWQTISLPLSWFLIYVLIVTTVTTEKRFFIFMLSFLLYNLKMSQHGARTWMGIGFGFQDWGATGAPGWFHNSGEFGIQMCIFLPLSVAFIAALRHRWSRWKLAFFLAMPVTAVMSMIASSSRGSLIGGAVLLVWMILRTRYRVRGLLVAGVVAAAVWVLIPAEQMERLRVMGEDETSVRRLDMWEDGIRIANENPVLGIGYDNWEGYYRAYHGGGLPHNIFIQAWAELGYVGLAAFLTLILGTFWVNWGSRRIARMLGERGRFIYFMAHGLDGALIGLLASGFFVTVLHYPFVWINLAMTVSLRVAAGHTARAVARARRAGERATRPRPAPALAGRGVVPAAPTPR